MCTTDVHKRSVIPHKSRRSPNSIGAVCKLVVHRRSPLLVDHSQIGNRAGNLEFVPCPHAVCHASGRPEMETESEADRKDKVPIKHHLLVTLHATLDV